MPRVYLISYWTRNKPFDNRGSAESTAEETAAAITEQIEIEGLRVTSQVVIHGLKATYRSVIKHINIS